ncbi:MAG: CRISPR-associated helicase Cas3' [Phycisphaerae bacterium]|jgi:CRISPR-associated endonuclease/helicase Cas3
MTDFWGHVAPSREGKEWEPLAEHLRLAADGNKYFAGAAGFAEVFGAGDWGRLIGLWHDIGKYSTEFQEYLRQANDVEAHLETRQGKVDHSSAGAQHAAAEYRGVTGQLLAYCIAGHHGGLPDNVDPGGGESGLASRLKKAICDYSATPQEILKQPKLHAPVFKPEDEGKSLSAFQLSVFCRMLYSCLVDADFLATEAFMQPEQAAERVQAPPAMAELLTRLDAHLERLAASAAKDSAVNRARVDVLAQCREKARCGPGLYSLTVPTGGGKTLSSLAFALHHAIAHDLRRVIYAIPFTSIIEQNAKVFRGALAGDGPDVVLEHHSNLESDKETRWGRLAAENWDAPIVVTTNVQLFESLFASKPSRCRKLHHIARSVIILDECQTLPVTLLAPTLRMLDELRRNYGCTVVLCSATQPAVEQREGFRIGLAGVREIIADPPALSASLQRVDVQRVGKLDNTAVVERLRQHERVLCVVNTRRHALELFTALCEATDSADGVFHLSTRMCAAHRTDVLARIRERLDPARPQPCRVISTQLIEAGVDIDFPVVFRAMTGLDSLAQAAGRCNREGRLPRGDVFVFDTDVDPRGDLRLRRQLGSEVAPEHDDLLGLEAIEHYFRLLYWTRQDEWDREKILGDFGFGGGGLHFQFREAARKYRLIPDGQQPVIVPYGSIGEKLVAELRAMIEDPGRNFDRRAQRHVVALYQWEFDQLRQNQAIAQYHERFWVLENNAAYDERVGLRTDVSGFTPEVLCQ